jgi:hypothetical protein
MNGLDVREKTGLQVELCSTQTKKTSEKSGCRTKPTGGRDLGRKKRKCSMTNASVNASGSSVIAMS